MSPTQDKVQIQHMDFTEGMWTACLLMLSFYPLRSIKAGHGHEDYPGGGYDKEATNHLLPRKIWVNSWFPWKILPHPFSKVNFPIVKHSFRKPIGFTPVVPKWTTCIWLSLSLPVVPDGISFRSHLGSLRTHWLLFSRTVTVALFITGITPFLRFRLRRYSYG